MTDNHYSPDDVHHLESFLQEEDGWIRLIYDTEDRTRTRLFTDLSIEGSTASCAPIGLDVDSVFVEIDDIVEISFVDRPHVPDIKLNTRCGVARQLVRVAQRAPKALHVPQLLTLLDEEDMLPEVRLDGPNPSPTLHRDTLRALCLAAEVQPENCTAAIPKLREILEAGSYPTHDNGHRLFALHTLHAIGHDDGEAISFLADQIIPYLNEEDEHVRAEAVLCLKAIADHDPADIAGAVPGIAATLADGVRCMDTIQDRQCVLPCNSQMAGLEILRLIAQEYPDEIESVSDILLQVAIDESLPIKERLTATATLGDVIKESPEVGVEHLDEITRLLLAENERLRNNGAALLYDVSTHRTDILKPYVDAIAALLVADDSKVRINASGVLARIAREHPERVFDHTETLVTSLDDVDPGVRENVCWGLGQIGASAAKEQLAELAQSDENTDVRRRAKWALEQCRN